MLLVCWICKQMHPINQLKSINLRKKYTEWRSPVKISVNFQQRRTEITLHRHAHHTFRGPPYQSYINIIINETFAFSNNKNKRVSHTFGLITSIYSNCNYEENDRFRRICEGATVKTMWPYVHRQYKAMR